MLLKTKKIYDLSNCYSDCLWCGKSGTLPSFLVGVLTADWGVGNFLFFLNLKNKYKKRILSWLVFLSVHRDHDFM